MNEMMKEWKREDRKGMKLSYPALLEPHLFEYHKNARTFSGNDVKVLMQRLNGLFGFPVKVVFENGRKFTGHLHKNGRNNGLIVINAKGKSIMFAYDDVIAVKWNRLHQPGVGSRKISKKGRTRRNRVQINVQL